MKQMSWKRNIFGCLMWVAYLLVIGTAMAFIGSAICGSIGVAEYIGGIAAVAYLLFAGLIVFALRKTAAKLKGIPYGKGKVFLWIECILAVVLSAAGLLLRLGQLQVESDGSVFLDLAYVSSEGQTVPQFSHGAVYLYIWVLRLVFMVLGNKAIAALWLQIVLQMIGVLTLYFAVRKMAGRVPSIMMLAFFMLSTYTVEKVTMLSPEMFYLLLFSVVLLYASRGVGRVFGCLFWLSAGIMAALLTYLDVAGVLLIFLMLGVIIARQKGAKRNIAKRMLGLAAGLFLGALSCVLVDALSSSKSVLGIMEAWVQLYRFEEPRFAVTLSGFSMVWLSTLLLCFMAWGIFCSWCGRKAESFSIWIFCLLVTALMQCFGIFTEEMSGALYIFFFSTVLAGLSIKESIAVPEADGSDVKLAKLAELVVEELDEDEKEKEKSVAEGDQKMNESIDEKETVETQTEEKQIEYIENPLPLPKKHVKRVMDYDYALDSKPGSEKDQDDYDISVSDDDDFDH